MTVAEAAGRAFGGMIYKLKQIKYTGYKTYKKLYETCIVPIMNYNNELNNVDHKGIWVNEMKDKILPIVGIYDIRFGVFFDLKEIECKLLNTLEQNWKAAVLCKPKL